LPTRVALVPLVWLALAPSAPPAAAADDPYPRDDELRVNHVASVGTHNSYHLRSPLFPPGAIPPDIDYEQAPLDVQLEEQGVRKFELDVYWDGELGVYRVHHITFVDQASTCEFLLDCLAILRDWSLAHRGHVPIFVFVEPKGIYMPGTITDGPICDTPEICYYDELDAEIYSVLAPEDGPDLLVTPDEVRGAHATLREAVLADGWPTLRQTRGRFVVVMLEGGSDRDGYAAGTPALAGRAMFVSSQPDRDDAAVMLRDDPIGSFDTIQDLVGENYVIRTRSDVPDLDPAPPSDPTRRDAALASGAQVISTDYPDEAILGNGYFVEIPGGMPSGCNPVSTLGLDCTPLDIENPAALVPEPASGASGAVAAAGLLGLAARLRRATRKAGGASAARGRSARAPLR
jgi:hypothetical protein